MTAAEQGFLLLTGYLGDPCRKPLTVAQFRELAKRARMMEQPLTDREMKEKDLLSLGYSHEKAAHILKLLSQTEQLRWYVEKGRRAGFACITRISEDYPRLLRKRLGLDAPGVLWAKGDTSILQKPAIALVGSRDIQPPNRAFAKEVGKQAALQGYVLVSGHARGADRTAQDSCLANGGEIVSVVSDRLDKCVADENVLYISEEGFDLDFSARRALQRNRIIHCLGEKTFVAQCAMKKGGTWDGTTQNLRLGWSPVYCFDDQSAVVEELAQRGAMEINADNLSAIRGLPAVEQSLFDETII